MDFKLEGEEYIVLQSLLKVCGVRETGGSAKAAIIAGKVTVDQTVETRRGKKIRAGQVVSFEGQQIKVIA